MAGLDNMAQMSWDRPFAPDMAGQDNIFVKVRQEKKHVFWCWR
jgi:hypothetical protein